MGATYFKIALAALAALTVIGGTLTAEDRPKLVVHEWGTFSGFSGSDGVPLQFQPANSDLPKFVHSSVRYSKSTLSGTISLETPVVYFYADRPLTAAVRAEFPGGAFTDWFPRAEHTSRGSVLNWPEISIQPGARPRLPATPGENHYYAARETDADALAVVDHSAPSQPSEVEKFLFYRGVGNLKTPLAVTAGSEGELSVKATGTESIPGLVVFQVKAGAIRFRQLGPLAAGDSATLTLPTESSPSEALRTTLVSMLTKAGLFEKEAKAMVKTWETTWFGDEGTRVLYLLPATWTDRTLPLKVTPKPDTLVRVMVGRHDVLTPEREREIDSIARKLHGPPGPERNAASAELAKLGRFAAPALGQAEKRLAIRR